MPRKFIYGPGLPGYGTAGMDGSAGLTGLGVFFSAYDGNSDTVTIKGKIIANKELFPNNLNIPGYPTRKYQTGDIFIDKNARVFQIDLNEPNLYKDTGIFLNTSGFFTEGPPQSLSPGFQRYSNSFETEKFLIDVVYTNLVGDYTQYPSSIYDNAATYFGKVSYIGNDILPDLNGWYPFEVWTIGNNTSGSNAIALARRGNTNEWHFGNFDNNSLRDVSIFLDFNDIYCPSIARSTSSSILFWDPITGRITHESPPSGMIMTNYGPNKVITAGVSATNIYANDNLTFDGSTLGIVYDISLGRDILLTSGGNHKIRVMSAGSGDGKDLDIYTDNFSINGYRAGHIYIYAGDGSGNIGSAGNGGPIRIASGKGGISTNNIGGRGGNLEIIGGDGSVGYTLGGDGGSLLIKSGNGGPGTGPYNNAGNGGDIDISAGYGATGYIGGKGGDIRITAGGFLSGSYHSGTPGNIYLTPGLSPDGSINTSGSVFIASDYSGNQKGKTRFAWGNSTNPGISFAASSDSGFFYGNTPRAYIGVSIQGTENFRFDVSTFHVDGNIVAYSSLISDIRLKKNIEDITNSLDKILKLRGITYERKSNGEKHAGYIAQEFEKIFPELVLESNIIGEDENVLYKTIKYIELIPYLSGAIQEQQKYINRLEEKVKYQDEKIELLIKELEIIKNKK